MNRSVGYPIPIELNIKDILKENNQLEFNVEIDIDYLSSYILSNYALN